MYTLSRVNRITSEAELNRASERSGAPEPERYANRRYPTNFGVRCLH